MPADARPSLRAVLALSDRGIAGFLMPRRFYDAVSELKEAVSVALRLVGAVEIHIQVADTRVTCGFWTEEELREYLEKQEAVKLVRTGKHMSRAVR
jgi:uncharacterized protein YjeT (DUF2065 family)